MPSVLSRPENISGVYNSEDEDEPAEDTPLLRMPPVATPAPDLFTMISASLLILVLVFGSSIGVYLLVLQNRSENVLPPEMQAVMDSRARQVSNHRMRRALFSNNTIYISETNTISCRTWATCKIVIKQMKIKRGNLPYHMFVCTNGKIIMTNPPPTWEDGFKIALFGTYNNATVPEVVVDSIKNYISKEYKLDYLHPYYKVIVPMSPEHNLYKAFENIAHFCKDC